MAPPTLIEQPADQCGLRQHRRADRQNLHTILIPRGGIAKVNLASRRQPAFADAPALHFPPVEHRRAKLDGWRLDVARLVSSEDANGDSGCLAAGISHQEKWPAYNLP